MPKTASQMSPSDPNMNPHAEAIVAMLIYGARYADQNGGCMDFWKTLSAPERMQVRDYVRRIKEARRA
jgi:hypothetical protein